jgi:hypothetical protein
MTARVEHHTATAHVHGLTLSALAWCVAIRCDHPGCSALHAVEGADEHAATLAARDCGWTWDGERDGCPAHPVGDRERGR